MPCTIVGVVSTSFKTKDNDRTIEGKMIYVTTPIDPKRNGQGVATDRFFLSEDRIKTLDFVPAPGQIVEVLYNRFGKIATLKFVDTELD